MNFVTDTHSLVWYFTNDKRLGKKALRSFEGTVKTGYIIIPTIVLAEIQFIFRNGRIPLSFSATLARIESTGNFEVAPLDIEVLKEADGIKYNLEMHDKLIVATALCYDAGLITHDEQITESKIVKTIW